MLVFLAAIWGSSFMLIKIALRGLDPATLALARASVGAVAVMAFVRLRMPLRAAFEVTSSAFRWLLVGALVNSALPFWLVSWGESRIDSGLAALLQASAPLFAALLAALIVRSERVHGARLSGIIVGFGGVALLVGATGAGTLLGSLAVLGSALCYAAAALYSGRRLSHLPVEITAFATLLLSAALLLPAGLLRLPSHMPEWDVLAAVGALGVAGSGIGFVVYFGLIAGAGGSRAILVTYLTPPAALLYGFAVLDEPVRATAVGGLALTLAGVALGTGLVPVARWRDGARRLFGSGVISGPSPEEATAVRFEVQTATSPEPPSSARAVS